MQESGIPPDKATCNILVQKCCLAGNSSAVTHVLHYMKDNSIVLRRPVFLEALEAFKNYGEIDHLLRDVNPHLASEGIEEEFDFKPTSNDICYIIDRELVINLLARRNFVAVEHILNALTHKDKQLDSELLSSVVQANCANNRTSGSLLAFDYSVKMKKKLDKSAYIALIGLFIRTNSFQNVLTIAEEMVDAGIHLGSYSIALLIHRLGCAGLSSFAVKIFDSFPTDQNVVTYTALISAYFQTNEVDKGLELYSKMRSQSIPVAYGTYEVMIVGLQAAGKFNDAEIYRKEKRRLQWHNYSLESLSTEESLCNGLFAGALSP